MKDGLHRFVWHDGQEGKRGFELSFVKLEQTLNTWNKSINSRIFHSGVNERVRRISFTRFIGTRVFSIIGSSYDYTTTEISTFSVSMN